MPFYVEADYNYQQILRVGVTKMGELVAVNDSLILFDTAALKREALMFNRIALPLFKSIAEEATQGSSRSPQVLAEVEWLMDKGVVFEPEANLNDERVKASKEFESYAKTVARYSPGIEESNKDGIEDLFHIDETGKLGLTAAGKRQLANTHAVMALNARYFSVQLRALSNVSSR